MVDRAKVLIVDDEPDILLMMRVNLEGEGFETVLAADGETALERIRADRPHAVLLDVMMPVLDGWGVLEALPREPSPHPAVVVVSAKANPGDIVRAYELGAADYVTKPFVMDDIVATLRDVLARSPEEREARRRAALDELDVERSER